MVNTAEAEVWFAVQYFIRAGMRFRFGGGEADPYILRVTTARKIKCLIYYTIPLNDIVKTWRVKEYGGRGQLSLHEKY